MTKQQTIDNALSFFNEGYACSQAVLLAFSNRYGVDERVAKLISSTFGGGMGRLRQKCGAVTGGFMVLGLQFGNDNPKDMDTKVHSYKKVRELNMQVENIYGTSNCVELLQKYANEDQVSERQHHKIICSRVVSEVTGLVWEMIENENNRL